MLKPKQKRKIRAYKLKYMHDMSHQEIADNLGLSYDTIAHYFREEEMQQIRKLWDEEEIEFMRFQALQEIQDVKRNGRNYISRALQHEEADDSTFLRAEKEERELLKDYIKMMQELDIFQKPEDRVEKTEKKDTESVRKDLSEIYEKYHGDSKEEEVEQDVDG